MATFAELKQLVITIDSISTTVKAEIRSILDKTNTLGLEASSASAARLEAIKTELAQLDADYNAARDKFLADGWNEKMAELKAGGDALTDKSEQEYIYKMWGIENAYTPSQIKGFKSQIADAKDFAKTNIEFRTKMLARSPQPATVASPSAATPATTPSTGPITQQSTTTAGQVTQANPREIKSEPTAAGTAQINTEQIPVSAKRQQPNPLHAYASYTYGLSLHLLSLEDYNKIVETGEYSPSRVLVASAGRYNEQNSGPTAFWRDPDFGDDFYFSELRMTTMIGIGASNRSTNAIDISFNLIEPYGMTFMDRLLNASDAVFSSNYLENPYLLQIDFFGMDETGEIKTPIPNITKKIPIKLLSMNVKMGTSGSEYQIVAQPFNHQAFNESVVNTPINLEITASTVNGFFKSTGAGAPTISKAGERSDKPAEKTYTTDQIYTAKSYADGLNAYTKQLEVQNSVAIADRYEFVFDTVIGESPLFADEASVSPSELKMADASTYSSAIAGNQGTATGSLNLKQRKFPIRQGSSIESVIQHLVKNSQFFTKQLVIRENTTEEKYNIDKEANKNKIAQWIKIVPSIKLLGFDQMTNLFAKEITYHVIPYDLSNVRFEEAPQKKATREDASKQYNYIYTGENDDILDINIEFNAMYYTSRTALRSNLLKTSGADAYTNNVLANGEGTCDVAPPAAKTITPNQIKNRHTDQGQLSGGGAKTATEIASADFVSSIATQSGADMLQVDLKIIGDPDFIKQDDVFYPIKFNANGEVDGQTRVLTPNGSIVTDSGEVIVILEFKTPMDIDDSNGEMRYDPKYKAVGFTGLYRVMSVDSVFESGKFTQTLSLIRFPNQDDKEVSKSKDERNETANWTSQPSANPPTDTTQATPATGDSGTDLNKPAVAEPTETKPELPYQDAAAGATQAINETLEPPLISPNFTPISVRGNRVPGEAAITQQ